MGGRRSQRPWPSHTSIMWAFSPMAPQVPGVTSGSPLCPWCLGTPYGEVRDTHPHQMELMPSSIIFVVSKPIFKLPSSLGVALCFPWSATPTMDLQIFHNPKFSFLGGPLAILDFFSKDLNYTRPAYFETHLGCPSFWGSHVRLH